VLCKDACLLSDATPSASKNNLGLLVTKGVYGNSTQGNKIKDAELLMMVLVF